MQITLTGSLGNISKPLAKHLVAAGHQVTIISSKADRSAAIEALGATPATGLISDVAFLEQAFRGADVVYTMVPPDFGAPDYRRYVGNTARNYAEAIRGAGITRVVNLSSIGAHLDGGTGMISGSYDAERALNALEGVAVKHVRAPFFYSNLYGQADLIKQQGIIGSNYAGRLVMVHPEDIAAALAEELQHPFTGKSVRYIMSDDLNTSDVARLLGAAIGRPELPWVQFTDEQALQGLLQGGIPPEIARNFVEMGTAVQSGILWTDFDAHKPQPSGNRDFKAFAQEFAAAF